MEDLEFYKYRKEAYEEDFRRQQTIRIEALRAKYLNKSYVGNSQMVEAAYETDKKLFEKELANQNKKDAYELGKLHFGAGGSISGLKQQMINEGRLESLKNKWLDQNQQQENKPQPPEVFTMAAENQMKKENKPEQSISKQFKETNQGMDMR